MEFGTPGSKKMTPGKKSAVKKGEKDAGPMAKKRKQESEEADDGFEGMGAEIKDEDGVEEF